MKNLFNNIDSFEKNRILEMHKKSTSNFYLTEQETSDDEYRNILNKVNDFRIKQGLEPMSDSELEFELEKEQKRKEGKLKPKITTGNGRLYGSFNREIWHNSDKPGSFSGGEFDADENDYDEREFDVDEYDDYLEYISGDNAPPWFGDESIWDRYHNSYNEPFVVKKRK